MCETSVRNAVFQVHRKCCTGRAAFEVLGEHLNKVKGIVAKFEPNKKYLVCRTLYQTKIEPIINQKI